MTTSRREFTKLVGVSAVAATATTSPVAALSLWERAEQEVEQSGEVSPELVRMMLDLHGPRGIFDQPGPFEELRASIARKVKDRAVIRRFAIPSDLEPILSFRR